MRENAPSRRFLAITGSALLATLLYCYLFHLTRRAFSGNPDFSCFYRAGRMFLAGHGRDIYNLAAERAFDGLLKGQLSAPGKPFYTEPFVFTPPTVLIFAPLAALPYHSADLIWLALNIAILIAVPVFLSKPLGLGTGATCAAILLPSLFLPSIWAIAEGQISIVLLGIFAMLFVSLYRDRHFATGCCIALTAIKPQFTFPALILALAARNWKALRGFAVTSLCLLLVSFYFVGWRATLEFPSTLISYSKLPVSWNGQLGEHPVDMPNLRGICYNLFSTPVSREISIALATVLCLLLLLVACRHSEVTGWFPALLITTLLVSYHGYAHDMALLALAVPLLLYSARITGWTATLAVLASAELALLVVPFVWLAERQRAESYFLLLIAALIQAYALILYDAVRTRGPVCRHSDPQQDLKSTNRLHERSLIGRA
jgi:hypothetical protein